MSATADPSLAFERATGPRQREALGLLLTGRPQPQDPAVDQFLDFIRQQKMSVDDLWLARHGGEAVASVLLVQAAGRAGMLFLSPPVTDSATRAAAALVERVCAAQDPARLRLVQAILDPWQEREARTLLDAGFRRLATLIYMQRATLRGDARLDLEAGLDVVQWSAAQRPLFEAAILASYRQTLDCPGLLGLRTIDDIITGHMASGKFVPDLWFALHREGEPAGVMLLSLVPPRRAAELVYLGLTPPWRGRGLGRRLVRFALGVAHAKRAATLLLAVDENNAPAVRLYESLGFTASARKLAMIRPMAAEA